MRKVVTKKGNRRSKRSVMMEGSKVIKEIQVNNEQLDR